MPFVIPRRVPEWLPILFVSCWILHARNEHRKALSVEDAMRDRDGHFKRRLRASLHMMDQLHLTS